MSIWLSADPLSAAALGWTPYRFCFNNPVNIVDPTGLLESTDVTLNDDGTATVQKVDVDDGDKGVYVVDENGNRTGERLGETVTTHSFVDENGKAVKGAVIDLNSTEGQDFIDNEIVGTDIGLHDYTQKAKGGEELDFKRRGIDQRGSQSPKQYMYRGSVTSDGKIGSARDFGNMGAGIVAGRAGLSWFEARAGFDGLQTYQEGWFAREPAVTRKAQRVGFDIGRALRKSDPAPAVRFRYE